MKKQHFYLLAGLFCLLIGLNTATAQEKEYLNENFNKSEHNFPPYGWLNIDADGDGSTWQASNPMDGYDMTVGATSYSWFMNSMEPDNWLITPPLYVEKATDSISYYFYAYSGNPEHYEVWISTKAPRVEDFTYLLDSMTFNSNITDWVRKAFSLKDFVGDTIYVGFRHKFQGTEGLSIVLDNVSGPQIVPFKKDLGVEAILSPKDLECDLQDVGIKVVVRNAGAETLSNFTLSCQSTGVLVEDAENEEHPLTFSDIISETVNRTLAPGDTLHYTFENKLPLSSYTDGYSYLVRCFTNLPDDEYAANDTIMVQNNKQFAFTLPLETGFEYGDPNFKGWYIPSVKADMPGISYGENPLFANNGSTYATFSAYPNYDTIACPPRTGEDAYLATRCLALEADMAYKFNCFYAFRVYNRGGDHKTINFRLIAGTDQHHLFDDAITLVDTVLTWDKPLVANGEQASYNVFSSLPFQVENSGTYYLGIMLYSDEPVRDYSQTHVIFMDDISVVDATAEMPVDLALQSVSAPYDCNLTDAETISCEIKNGSTVSADSIRVAYRINNGEWVEELITRPILPNEIYTYDFKTPANLSDFGKYKIDGKIAHVADRNPDNNENSSVTENTQVKELPYTDDFELYGSLLNFEDEYRLFSTGYFSWMAAFDYSEDTNFAYNGVGFLADASDNERNANVDDWLIGRCLQFKKDSTYEISFAYRIEAEAPQQAHLDAYLLSAYDTNAVVAEIGKLQPCNTAYTVFKGQYTPTEDAVLHFALHSHAEIGAPIVMIDALYIGAPRQAPTANDRLLNGHMEVYPNPADDYLTVQSDFAAEGLKLTNMMGETVYQTTFDAAGPIHLTLNTATYKPGIYFLTLYAKEATIAVKKVVIR